MYFIVLDKPINLLGEKAPNINFAVIFGNILALQGIFFKPLELNSVLWTLSIEIFFYACAPFFFKISQKLIFFMIFSSAAFYLLSRYIQLPSHLDLMYFGNMFLYGWAWLIGFWFFRNNSNEFNFVVAMLVGLIALSFHSPFLPYLWPITYLLVILSINYSKYINLKKILLYKICDFLGDISYPMYLFHLPICYLLFVYDVRIPWIYIITILSVSTILHLFYDIPLKRLIRVKMFS